jgi:hypothetical protein
MEPIMPKKCLRCGHEWISHLDNPKCCPGCKSPYWNKPKGEGFVRADQLIQKDETFNQFIEDEIAKYISINKKTRKEAIGIIMDLGVQLSRAKRVKGEL